jgi:predicted HAD superfamily Cof-like phosphohydrolase
MEPKTLFTKVCDTYVHHGIPMAKKPTLPALDEFDFRFSFMLEEIGELQTAYHTNNIIDMADALGDLAIVINGMAASMGLPFDAITNAINTSNYNGKRIATSRGESKRGYEYDLVKTKEFSSPENIIKILIDKVK